MFLSCCHISNDNWPIQKTIARLSSNIFIYDNTNKRKTVKAKLRSDKLISTALEWVIYSSVLWKTEIAKIVKNINYFHTCIIYTCSTWFLCFSLADSPLKTNRYSLQTFLPFLPKPSRRHAGDVTGAQTLCFYSLFPCPGAHARLETPFTPCFTHSLCSSPLCCKLLVMAKALPVYMYIAHCLLCSCSQAVPHSLWDQPWQHLLIHSTLASAPCMSTSSFSVCSCRSQVFTSHPVSLFVSLEELF